MKTLRFSILGLLAMVAFVGRAQITDPGRYNLDQTNTDVSDTVTAPQEMSAIATGPFEPLLSQTNSADVITPRIQALADGLQDDPLKIYNYVHDHIRYVLYFGSKKGADLTLLEKSGNDFDQSSLLVALLRAAGYSSWYQFAWQNVPYDNPDGSHNDLHHWLQLNFSNSNWNTTSNYLKRLFFNVRGYPSVQYLSQWYPTETNSMLFQRVWVLAYINGTYYWLDPAYKVSEPVSGINLISATGFNSNNLVTTTGGIDTGNYVTNLNESALNGALNGYTTNLLNYLQSNSPNASVDQILGGWRIVPSTNTTFSTKTLFPIYTWNQPPSEVMPLVTWTAIPTNLTTTFTVSIGNTNYSWFTPQFQGQRLSLTFDTSGLAQIWQDDTLLMQKATSGSASTTNVVFSINQPFGTWDSASNNLIPGIFGDVTLTNSYQRTNATYALIYAFEPDWGCLQERQNQLANYRQQGLADTSRQVVSETLNIMGMNWMLQTENAGHFFETQMGILPQYHCRLGRMAQEAGHGYYVDVYMELDGFISNAGWDATNQDRQNREFDLTGFLNSALEHGIIEQLQNTNLVGASTVKMLEIANTNGQAVFLASSTNWTSNFNVQSRLINYDSATKTTIGNLVSKGYVILLPQNGSNHVAAAGSWAGYGFEALSNNSTNRDQGMYISGGYHGGYPAYPYLPDYSYVYSAGQSQPASFTICPISTANPTIADPVDTADGTLQVEHTDLSLGQTEPRGITLSRYYNGTRRYSNLAGMAGGWIHNYAVTANTVPAPQAGLGGTTPAQAAPMIASTCAASGIYNTAQDPKNWMVTTLITKWAVDQLSKNGVSAILGKDTVQFVKQPNGVFTPPANCTMTLIQTNSVYWLQERHGNTFKFDSLGRLASIVDQYNNSLSVAYLSTTSNLPQTVTDWKNRTLTFNYTGSQLTSVSDGTRTVNYAYSATNAQGALTSFTDPEGKTSTYTYDTNHQITATLDAQSRLVVSNLYNTQGHITTQYTQGDPNKTWRIFWSGWQTIEQDPAGSQRIFSYDDQRRLINLRDQLGNLTQSFYDGQNHVVMTVSPLNETNLFGYDDNNNLTNSVDPLGFTNQFVYDSQNDLIKSIDPRSNANTFGYNAQYSLTGQTNGAGDWVNYDYNSDGTLHTRADIGGVTTYDSYDNYGQLTHITYPDGLGGESFVNSSLGDVTSHTDANGNVTTFSYNNRRQLTNSVAPTNLVTRISYDSVGNTASTTDARGNATSNTWSATRHLLATALPATPQGAPVVTNIYDNRDWLIRTLDPLQQPTLYTNDADGRLISLTDPLLRTSRFGYDADGRKIATTNAAQEVTSQTWDARGSLIKLTDGAGHTSLRAYDGAGNQIILTNRNRKKWQFEFDGANRLTNTITPRGYSTSLAFNHQGLPVSIKQPSGNTATLSYDARGRLTNRTDNVATTLYSYDANNNLTSVTNVGQASSLSQTFDAYNRVSSFKDAYGNLIQYRYDADGNVTNLIYPGNRTVTYFYDSLNRLTNVTDWAGRKTSIAYDLAGRVTDITRPNGTYRTISYDATGQATNIWEQMANTLPIAWFRHNWTNSGNMAWEFAAPLPHTNTPPLRTMTYDDDNRLMTVNGTNSVNDSDGNLTWGPLPNGAFTNYTYDARNRLLSAGSVTNIYDAANNRIRQTYGTNSGVYIVNPNAKLPQVLMRVKSGVTNYYIYGAGFLYQITETATSTNTLTYHYDYRGSTIALTDDNGLVTDRIEYSAYGLTTYRTGNTDTPFLFNGRYGVQTEPNGLLNMRARYYNPYLCRFLNPDPSGFSGGLNFYAYANGNPVNYIDPFGLGAVGENVNTSWVNSWNPSEFYEEAAAWQNDINNSHSWPVAGALDTLVSIGAGYASIPYIGSGSGTFSAKPSWETAPGLLGDIGTGAGLLAGGLSPLPSMNAPLFGGSTVTAGTTSAFWSGWGSRSAAESWAANNGGQTLSMSPFAVGENATLAEAQSASASFARSASGNVQVFQPAAGVPINSIWSQFEYPALMQNPNVSGITYQIINGSGNVIRTIPVPR